MGLVDTHAHYDDEQFLPDGEQLLASLPEHGIKGVINAGVNVKTSENGKLLAEKYPFVWFAAGIHPSDAPLITDQNEALDALRILLAHPKAVAVGEIGLDYHYGAEDAEIQKNWLDLQLSLAEECGKPVVIHDREAHGDTMDILRAHPKVRGVFHSYSGSLEMAKELLKKDWMLSFTGVITFKNAHKPVEVVAYTPLTSMMLETDCPYLAPVPHRGERNSSLFLHHTAEKMAEILAIGLDEVERMTTENAERFFGIRI